MIRLMNKINIENTKLFLEKNDSYYLEISEKGHLEIIVKKDITAKLIIVSNHDYRLDVLEEENSNLVVNALNKNNNVDVNVKLCKNSILTYNHSVFCNQNSNNIFNIVHLENDSISVLNNSGINLSHGKLFFEINGKVFKNLHNISCNQNSRIINFSCGDSKIIPNLIVDTNDIAANHSSYIGKIDDDVLFYLESRGIQKESIKKLIYKSYMLGKMNLEEEQEVFNKLINEWW